MSSTRYSTLGQCQTERPRLAANICKRSLPPRGLSSRLLAVNEAQRQAPQRHSRKVYPDPPDHPSPSCRGRDHASHKEATQRLADGHTGEGRLLAGGGGQTQEAPYEPSMTGRWQAPTDAVFASGASPIAIPGKRRDNPARGSTSEGPSCAAGAVRTSRSGPILKLVHMRDRCMWMRMGRLFTTRSGTGRISANQTLVVQGQRWQRNGHRCVNIRANLHNRRAKTLSVQPGGATGQKSPFSILYEPYTSFSHCQMDNYRMPVHSQRGLVSVQFRTVIAWYVGGGGPKMVGSRVIIKPRAQIRAT